MSQTVSSSSTVAKELRAIQVLFGCIVGGIALFIIAALVIVQQKGQQRLELPVNKNILQWSLAAFCLICIVIAKRIFNKEIAAAKNSLNPLKEKLNGYRSALIRYLALCEAPAILSILLFIFTGNFIFQAYAAVMAGFMAAMMPGRRRIVTELELDAQQEKELE